MNEYDTPTKEDVGRTVYRWVIIHSDGRQTRSMELFGSEMCATDDASRYRRTPSDRLRIEPRITAALFTWVLHHSDGSHSHSAGFFDSQEKAIQAAWKVAIPKDLIQIFTSTSDIEPIIASRILQHFDDGPYSWATAGMIACSHLVCTIQSA